MPQNFFSTLFGLVCILLTWIHNKLNWIQILPQIMIFPLPSRNITTQDDIVQIYSQSLPFDIHVQSIPTYNTFEYGYNYSSAGLKIHLKRNSLGLIIHIKIHTIYFLYCKIIIFPLWFDMYFNILGLLTGSVYGPMCIFSLLSMLSYCIDIEMVM